MPLNILLNSTGKRDIVWRAQDGNQDIPAGFFTWQLTVSHFPSLHPDFPIFIMGIIAPTHLEKVMLEL